MQPPDGQPGTRGRRRPAPARERLDARGVAQRRLGLVTARRRAGHHLRRRRLRRRRHARHDRTRRRLRRAEPEPEPAIRPTALSALAGDGQRNALLDGAEPSTEARRSRVTRCIAHEPGTRRPSSPTPAARRRTWTPGSTNGPAYYYKVSAETPTARARSPTRPLRPHPTSSRRSSRCRPSTPSTAARTRSPTPGAGRTAITGSVETGPTRPRTRSHARRRRPAQPGVTPPSTALTSRSGRLSTLPGVNNQLRLLRPRPAAGHYCLRRLHAASQPTRGDRPGLHRAGRQRGDRRLLTVNQELAAGDVLLLRVKGSTLEAWRNDGSAWSRLGTTRTPRTPASAS